MKLFANLQKRMRNTILFFFMLLFLPGVAGGQVAYAPEKVFVHLDRTYFAVGETIWMKGYVESAVPVPDTSRFLYVELMDGQKGEAKLRTKIRLGEDGFAGHMDLPEDLPGGRYTLRAYTRWQLNWPEERMFHTSVDIYDGSDPQAALHDAEDIDVSFYPEGGRYFNGTFASIGFKAMAPDGRSVDWEGALYDDTGTLICDCHTEHAGMGLLGFTPQDGRHYRLVSKDGGQSWLLPDAASAGATLQVRRMGNHFVVQVINRTGGRLFLQMSKEGSRVVLSEIEKADQILRVPATVPGLQKFLLVNDKGTLLAERAVYGEYTAASAQISIVCDAPAYTPKEKWNVRLHLPEEVAADVADVSVSVVRRAFRNYQQEGNLLSYMLLSSELRGHIEEPEYYFNPEIPVSTRQNHLDLLLMIQGWTYYDDTEIVSEAFFPKETMQALRGEVRSVFKAQPKRFTLTLMAPERGQIQITEVDKGSQFVVDSLDFPDSTLFIVIVDKVRGTKSYYPVMEEDFAPIVLQDRATRSTGKKKAMAQDISPSSVQDPDADPVFQQADVLRDTIQTAVIQAVAPRIQSPFGYSELPNIKEQKDFVSYGNHNLLDYILMNNVNLRYNGEEVVNLKTAYVSEVVPSEKVEDETSPKYQTVSLFVNGRRMPWDIAETIMMGDVQRLSVTTYMSSDAFLARTYGGIVLVELVEGGRLSSIDKQTNAIVVRPLGYQLPKEFYNPVYERRRSYTVPDRRNTVYWNPSVRITADKPAILQLMTEDRADGPYLIRIEGRTSDGRWISGTQILR